MDGWKGTMIILTFQTARICSEEDVGRESVVMLAICMILHSSIPFRQGHGVWPESRFLAVMFMSIRLFKGTVDSRYYKVLRPEKLHCDIGIVLHMYINVAETMKYKEILNFGTGEVILLEWNIIIQCSCTYMKTCKMHVNQRQVIWTSLDVIPVWYIGL